MTRFALAASLALVGVGCSSQYVRRDIYDRDMAAAREYQQTLERRNSDLESKNQGFGSLQDMQLVARTQDELYQQIAESLKAALEGFRQDGDSAMNWDPKLGKWTAGTDLLFDSGSWTVTAKGMEVLKKFADAHKGKTMRFRIVGHTDRAPITRPKTVQALDTDTNMELSARRAVAVMGALKKFGMSESQFVECVGMGNQQPVAPNDRIAANMKRNRRVEIFVTK